MIQKHIGGGSLYWKAKFPKLLVPISHFICGNYISSVSFQSLNPVWDKAYDLSHSASMLKIKLTEALDPIELLAHPNLFKLCCWLYYNTDNMFVCLFDGV
jgi:hypothetical protein